ncbi:MAG: ArnT family glycosyltransferase [Candidatus Kapaibacterium sp.]
MGTVVFLQFYRLDLGEIQSHDEARYILRAEACLRFGAWMDQTQYAIGGLFSSSHPPLIVWMMAIVQFLFGTSVFAVRLVSPIGAVVALHFFYKLSGKLFSRETALYATIALGAAQHFLLYSHHGQFDIPMFAFIVSASYYAIRSFEEGNMRLACIAGMLFGCVLLSKTIQGIYLLPFLCTLPYIYRTKRRYIILAVMLGICLAVSLPWHLFMIFRHPDFFNINTGLISALKTNSYAEGHTITHWWYYLNVTIVNFPFIVLGIVAIVPLFKRLKKPAGTYNRMCLISAIWFVGMVVSLSDFSTRMLHFSLFLLLPTSLFLCFCLEEFLRFRDKPKIIAGCILLISALGWSLSELIRMSFKEHTFHPIPINAPLLLLSVGFALIIFLLLFKYGSSSPPRIIMLIAAIFLITTNIYRWGSRRNETFIDGAEDVGKVLFHTSGIHTLIAYHIGGSYQYMLPQLNYYTDCWLAGWDSTRTGTTNTWSKLDSLISVNQVPRSDASVIYNSWDAFYTPKQDEKELLMRINQGLSARYAKVLHTKKYQLYWEPR